MCRSFTFVEPGDAGAQGIQAAVDVLVTPSICSMFWIVLRPSALMAAISSATPARMSGEVMRVARRRRRWSWPMTVAAVGVTEDDLGPHVDQLVNEEKAALEHLLVNQHSSLGLRGHHQEDRQQVGCKAGPRASAMVMIEPSMNVSMA